MTFKVITLDEIEKELETSPTPGRLADLRVLLSAKYAYATNEYEKILMDKPSIWGKMRLNHKSDTATEREWEGTPEGRAEMHWKFQIKKIDKMMSAIKTLIEVKTGEARNLY